jgi:alpha-glucosidase
VEGGTTVRDFDAGLGIGNDHIGFILPTYIRAGGIIPTIELEQYVGELASKGIPNPITLNIYPGQSGSYVMYLDDGVSRSSAPVRPEERGGDDEARGEYRETHVTHEQNGKTRQVRIQRKHDRYTPPLEKFFFVAILHDPLEPRGANGPLASVSVAGQNIAPIQGGLPEHRADSLNNATSSMWYYNNNVNISYIKVFDDKSDVAISLAYT